mgnify:CR=1 FL=1
MFNPFKRVSDKALLNILAPEKGVAFFGEGGRFQIVRLTHTEKNKIYHFELGEYKRISPKIHPIILKLFI